MGFRVQVNTNVYYREKTQLQPVNDFVRSSALLQRLSRTCGYGIRLWNLCTVSLT